jgi:cytidylate kinase
MVVAIDGPAGAGKSTVARALARALGFTYLDSGAMYRTVGLLTLRHGGPASEQAERLALELGDRVVANGEDVTEAIRAPEVSEAASRVATNERVRAALARKQRELLSRGDWVAEGRDIGTVVAPDAAVKVLSSSRPTRTSGRAGARPSWAPRWRWSGATRRCGTPRTPRASTRRWRWRRAPWSWTLPGSRWTT